MTRASQDGKDKSAPVALSARARLVNQALKINSRFWQQQQQVLVPLLREREARNAKLIPQTPANVVQTPLNWKQVPVLKLAAMGASPSHAVLYLHGGGFIAGSPTLGYRDFVWRVSEAVGAVVYAVDYAKAPEHPFPKALHQALSVYRQLVDQLGAENIVVVGDSAGGGLAFSLLLKLREVGEEGLAQPAAVAAISPWTDLTNQRASRTSNLDTELMVPVRFLDQIAKLYYADEDPRNPYVSPIYAELSGLPKTLIQVSDAEALLDDSVDLARRLRECGVTVELAVWRGLPHVWPVFAAVMPEAQAALDEMAEFLREALGLRAAAN